MFSEELRILDRNTVKYMLKEQQQEIATLRAENQALQTEIKQREAFIQLQKMVIKQNNTILALSQRNELLEQKLEMSKSE